MGAFDGITNWVKSQYRGYDVAATKKKDEETRKAIEAATRTAYQRQKTPQAKKALLSRAIENERDKSWVKLDNGTYVQPKSQNNLSAFSNAAATNIVYNNPLSPLAWQNWIGSGAEYLGTATGNKGLQDFGSRQLNTRRQLESFNNQQAMDQKANAAGNAVGSVINAGTLAGSPVFQGKGVAPTMGRWGFSGVRYGLPSAADTAYAIRQNGGSRNAQTTGGLLTGAVGTFMGARGLDRMGAKNTGAGLFKNILAGANAEGLEEVVEYGVDDAVARATYDGDRSWKESLANAGSSYAGGAFAGGLFSGANARYGVGKTETEGKQQFKQDAKTVNDNVNHGRVVERIKDLDNRIAKADEKIKNGFVNNKKQYNEGIQEKQELVKQKKRLEKQEKILRNRLGLSLELTNDAELNDQNGPQANQSLDQGSKIVSSDTNIPRSQLSGRALSTPSQEIGRALGMSDQQMQDAVNTRDNLEQSNPEKVKNLESRYLTTRLNQLDSQTTSSKTTGIDTGNTSTNLQEQDIRAIPYDRSIAQSINEQVNHPQLPKNKRVNVVDYFRTPQKVLEKIGLADSGKALVEADRAYKKELPQQIERITNWNERIGQDSEASTRIFKYLDGQKGAKKNLRGNELEVANEMKQYLADWADRLKLPKDNRVTNYITHIFEDQLLQKDFDPDLAKLIDDKVPGSVYDPFTQQRLGKQGYVEDVIRALDAYTKRAVRKANMDPALEILNNQAEALDLESWKYVKKLGDKINMRPTEADNLIDNLIKDSTPIGYKYGQRPFSRAAQAIRTATYRATLGLNIGSAVRNLTQGINTYAELGGRWTGTGYASVVRKMFNGGNTELEQVGVLDNSFIEDRTLSAKKKAIQKADKVLFSLFEKAEQINRGAAYYGAKQKAISEGKSTQQAIDAGVEAARKTQFTFGRVETPVALQGDINKLFTQFQSYNFKQAEFVGGMVSNKEYAKLTRYTVATLAVFALMSKALGYRPEDMLPFGSNVKDGKLPIATAPAFRVLPETIDFAKSVFSTPSENARTDKATKIKEAGKDLGSAVGTVTIPGFVQAKKSYGGAKAYTEGEMERWGEGTVKIEQTPQNLAKGLVFGPYTMRTVDSPTQKTVKTNGEVVRPEGQIAITTKTEKDDSGKFVSRDKYDAVINAYTKADKTLDGGTTTSLGNIQKYDNEELSGAIKDTANEAVKYLEQQGITGIKADSKLAVLYAKYKKSTAQDPEKAFATALVKAYPFLKEQATKSKKSKKSGGRGGKTGTKTSLKQAIAYATARTPSLPAFKLSGGQAPSAKLAIPSVRTSGSSPKGRQYTVKVQKLS